MVPRAAARAAVLIALAVGGPDALIGQRTEPDTTAADTARAGQPVDTAAARRLGLPTQPSRSFPPADSMIEALMARTGFEITRYRADSVTLFARTREVVLEGEVLLERGGSVLEADSVRYFDISCMVHAMGRPVLFEGGNVLVGEGMRYDACAGRGTVRNALTDFDQGGVTWYLRGQMALDSSSTRLHAAGSNVTSCNLPAAHYHFRAGAMKWITKTVFVARPAVLYVRDVPVLWLPFIFQDIRSGRRSGILVPRFGINDLVRPSRSYRRHVSGFGYYWAMSDYTDLQVMLDWYDDRYLAVTGQFNYRWLNRFIQGGVRMTRQQQVDGSASNNIQWSHRQSFSSRSSLNASVNYSSNTRVVSRNAVDPTNLIANIDSRINYSRTFDWGQLNIGGNRSQSITGPQVTQTLPTVAFTPSPVDVGGSITWSPSFSLTNTQQFRQPGGTFRVPGPGGTVDTTELLADTRRTSVSLNTPLRIGSWNWNNRLEVADFRTNARSVETALAADSASQLVTVFGGDFSTGVDWNTGVGLPSLFRGSWRLQPSVSIQNSTSGPFLLRNRNTGGRWVQQGKRLAFGASLSPTFFGFFPGIGPLTRIRHSVSPSVRWQFAPSASVPEDYARALDPTGSTVGRRSDQQQRVTVSLSQTFEGKLALPPGDTTSDPRNAPKRKLLQVSTSSITYDFEQATKPDRTGWTTQTLSNTLTSDLLRGFSLTLTHDLWDGPVGLKSSSFDPFLTSISARASLTAGTLGPVLGLLGIGAPSPAEAPAPETTAGDTGFVGPGAPLGPRYNTLDRLAPRRIGQQGFDLGLTFDASRQRPDTAGLLRTDRRNLGISLSFNPTAKWSAAWTTAYNLETKEFDQHVVRLDRDLHRWRATFSFVKLANGNFVFNFSVQLTDQPEIEFEYDQQTVGQ